MTKRATRASNIALPATRPRPRRVAQRATLKKRLKTAFALSFLAIETVIAILLVFVAAFISRTEPPDVDGLANGGDTPVATTIWSQDGVLLAKFEPENRLPVELTKIPKEVIDATIAIEDHRFYEHSGVDFQGIFRAAWANLRGSSQGASTLTQQLVRNIEQFGLSKEKRLSRKVREALYALRVEQVYSKKDILKLYLNNIYYGAGAYGIQAASLTYFGKSAYKLSLSEAALLAGLPQRPTDLNPYFHRKAALKRREDVLAHMLEYGYINQTQFEKAKDETPKLMPPPKHRSFDFKAPYFTTYVMRELTRKYGPDVIYKGWKIETTLNYKMQLKAQEALENGLERAEGRQANQGAIVSLDNHTGYIRALVGGRSWKADQFNAVTQGRRQPGSTFKLFVYSSAFDTEAFNSLEQGLEDKTFPYPGDPQHRAVAGSGKWMSFRSAIKFSKNAVAIRVADEVGIDKVIEYAKKMGITTPLDPYLPTALGASAVRPLDLCSAYSILPNKGVRYQPMAIARITDAHGELIKEFPPMQLPNVFDRPQTVEMMDQALEGVVNGGTANAARGNEGNGIVENARGKTGTTNDNRDVWFAGYTPELTTVVWVANVHRRGNKKTYEPMPGAYGGIVCAPIWHDFMVAAIPEQRKFHLPDQPIVVAANAPPELSEKPKRPRDKKKTKPDEHPTVAQPANNEENPDMPDDGTQEPGSPDGQPETSPPGGTGPDTAPPVASPPGDAPELTRPAPLPRNGRAAAPSGNPDLRTKPPAPVISTQKMVTLHICTESGDIANSACNTFNIVNMPASRAAKMRRCRLHKPPPGEGG